MSSRNRFWVVGVLVLVLGASGCSTVKGWLKPWVCDCDAPATTACPPETVDSDYQDELVESSVGGPVEEIEEIDEDPTASALPSRSPIAEGNPYDPTAPESKTSRQNLETENTKLRDAFAFRGELTAPRQAFRGKFSLKGEDELLLVERDGRVEVYNGSGRAANRRTPRSLATYTAAPPATAVEVVRD